jgi:uncharacterized protein
LIAVAGFATALPARESTGALLPLLILGDLLALRLYRRHADWRILARLAPWLLAGIVAGAVFVAQVDDAVMRRSIGVLLLALLAGQWITARIWPDQEDQRVAAHPLAAAAAGVLAGFATMVANAAGTVMTIFFLLSGLAILRFLGTGAWLFFFVNVAKAPFSAGLGLITLDSLWTDLRLAPFVLIGGAAGGWLIRRIRQRQFEIATIGLAAVSALYLVVR